GVELPQLLAGLGVVRDDEAVLALALLTRAVGQHLAVGDENATGGLAAIARFGFPAQLAGDCVERDDVPVGRGEIDHVLVYAEALAARRSRVHALVVVA